MGMRGNLISSDLSILSRRIKTQKDTYVARDSVPSKVLSAPSTNTE